MLVNVNCTWSSKVFICSICYLTIHLLSVSLKRKTNNIFTIIRRMTTVEKVQEQLFLYNNTYGLSPYLTEMRRVPTVLRIDSRNRRQKFACMHRELVANGRESLKHVILFCATKIIAKLSPSHHICCEPVANPSQGCFRDLHNATNMQHK